MTMTELFVVVKTNTLFAVYRPLFRRETLEG